MMLCERLGMVAFRSVFILIVLLHAVVSDKIDVPSKSISQCKLGLVSPVQKVFYETLKVRQLIWAQFHARITIGAVTYFRDQLSEIPDRLVIRKQCIPTATVIQLL
ncbi:Cyclic di-GMP phosphodiesterase CdpA [Frankliniella fusca]|uniref:Cyclic di-GMP phosphodiesterase CdpA n=1 Tax=Frankliniella fusca TaxID=407009 RepID=A0AAE1HT84_9NEOP|nr:Cyclic di-GMP phosphodiesterase CdpA [Frankliniella fusca]